MSLARAKRVVRCSACAMCGGKEKARDGRGLGVVSRSGQAGRLRYRAYAPIIVTSGSKATCRR